ncbi:putative uncharacterized protein MSANTD5 [Psammomys obesus]|uniref:putative uncharacterized protein MSANTD5 n=1 Tax=Psammomys obesus TaxID=48139 RepID=UPI002452C128|nr:putative uncharacterized protein MSANTD5 [Psammomys obesus]
MCGFDFISLTSPTPSQAVVLKMISGDDERMAQPASRWESGPSHSRWTDSEIRVFLQEWEVVEQEVSYPGRKIHKKTKALCQRLYQRGLKKTWKSCFDLLLTMQGLHWTLCNEKPRMGSLFSPYAEALYRILGYPCQRSPFPGPLSDGAGNPLFPTYPQPPMVLPSPVCQPWDYGFPAPSGELQGNPSPMVFVEHSQVPGYEPWNPGYPAVPPLLPAPGDTSLQQPGSVCDNNPSLP